MSKKNALNSSAKVNFIKFEDSVFIVRKEAYCFVALIQTFSSELTDHVQYMQLLGQAVQLLTQNETE